MAASKKDQDQDQAPDAGQTAQPAQPTQKEYVVLHNGVGPWWQGQTLTVLVAWPAPRPTARR
jgi:hypothetical protein